MIFPDVHGCFLFSDFSIRDAYPNYILSCWFKTVHVLYEKSEMENGLNMGCSTDLSKARSVLRLPRLISNPVIQGADFRF